MNSKKRQISIFNIIGAGYGVLVLIILGISILSINRISFIDRNLAEINNVNSAKQRVTIDYRGSVHNRSISIRDVVLADNQEDLDKYLEEIRFEEQFYIDAKNRMLENFINNDKNEHTHLFTKEWGKGDLSSEKQNLDENVELINLVTVRYFKDDE